MDVRERETKEKGLKIRLEHLSREKEVKNGLEQGKKQLIKIQKMKRRRRRTLFHGK